MGLSHVMHLIHRQRSRILLIMTLLFSVQVKAYEFCDTSTDVAIDHYIPLIGSGISTVGEDVPVGTVIYKSFDRSAGGVMKLGCRPITRDEYDAGAKEARIYPKLRWDVISAPSGAAVGDIFPTNITGIGARISMYIQGSPGMIMASTLPQVYDNGYNCAPCGSALLNNALSGGAVLFDQFQLELIKTGPIPAGTQQVLGAMLPTIQIYGGVKVVERADGSEYDEFSVLTNIHFGGDVTLYTKTCQLATSQVDVYLGRHWASSFSGPGSATPWQDFDITLKDCPPFYGHGDYMMSGSGVYIDDYSTTNQIAFTFSSVHGTVDNNPLLAKLESRPDSATGVGIEVSERNATSSINLDGTGSFNVSNLTENDGASYTIPLKARYVQYDSQIKEGIANGAVVFTINYL